MRDDLKRILRLREPVEVTGSVDRPNLRLEVVEGDAMEEEEERADLYEWLCEHEGAGLVYCGRRQTCDALADALAEAGVDAAAYHAGNPNLNPNPNPNPIPHPNPNPNPNPNSNPNPNPNPNTG